MDKKDELYYDAMDFISMGENNKAIDLLQEALIMDKDYVQTYVGLVAAYDNAGDDKKRIKATEIGFEKTKKKFTKWPKEMHWGNMDNRAYLRAIQYMGELYWDSGNLEGAIEIFRLLLKLNPGDNQGIRYEIVALYAGLSGEDVDKMFEDGNKTQNWDELEILVETQNKKHNFRVEYDF